MTSASRREPVIRVVGARQHNLRDLSLVLPKGRLIVVTGVSGSGKSSLVFDVLAADSQRQLNESFPAFVRARLPHRSRPDVARIAGLGVVIAVDQSPLGTSSRSTVGTATEIGTLLRLLFSRATSPYVGESTAFSFNDRRGMCLHCDGLGEVVDIDVDALIDPSRSLAQGAIRFPTFQPGGWRWKRYAHAGLFDLDRPIGDYSARDRELLLHGEVMRPPHPGPDWPKSATYEGVVPRLRKAFLTSAPTAEAERRSADLERVVRTQRCPSCWGQRLNEQARSARVAGYSLPELNAREVGELPAVLRRIDMPQLGPVLSSIEDRVAALTDVGLGYLSLDRATPSLSGGESQRVKLVRHLGSSLVDLTYVLDEPSAGLHPHDVVQIVALLRRLRDKGNTIVVVDHNPAVISAADQVVDLGPGGGEHGGTLTYQGSVTGLRRSRTATGRALRHRPPVNPDPRQPTGWVRVRDARHNNLVGLDVDVPLGVLVVLSGVAGSGKSTLATTVLPRLTPVTIVDQGAPRKSARSSVLTWLGLAQTLRSRYARLSGQPPGMFSRNGGGACSNCRGLGTITTDLAYLEDVTAICETCEGTGYNDQALSVRVDGRTIADTLALTVSQASSTNVVPSQALHTLTDVGLGYVRLGQSLSALSGGERQRLKLAGTLQHPGSDLLVLDEPTSGLHPDDVSGLLTVLQRAVDDGRSLLLVEHHPAVILAADWVIDLGPGAGSGGGRLLHTGPPAQLLEVESSRTARHLQATSRQT